jgi:hypothetical protein
VPPTWKAFPLPALRSLVGIDSTEAECSVIKALFHGERDEWKHKKPMISEVLDDRVKNNRGATWPHSHKRPQNPSSRKVVQNFGVAPY